MKMRCRSCGRFSREIWCQPCADRADRELIAWQASDAADYEPVVAPGDIEAIRQPSSTDKKRIRGGEQN
jgi:hypothetical protein